MSASGVSACSADGSICSSSRTQPRRNSSTGPPPIASRHRSPVRRAIDRPRPATRRGTTPGRRHAGSFHSRCAGSCAAGAERSPSDHADARRELRAHRMNERVVLLGRMMPRHLERQYELLAALGADAEGGGVSGTQVRVAALRRELDVVRIEVAALQDDEILQPTCDEQVAVALRPEVARAQIHRLGADAARAEGSGGFLRSAPIALRDARTGDPDLADRVVGHLLERIGIDDAHVVLACRLARRGEQRGLLPRGWRVDPSFLQRAAARDARRQRLLRRPARDEQRALRQPVARQHDVRTQPARRRTPPRTARWCPPAPAPRR